MGLLFGMIGFIWVIYVCLVFGLFVLGGLIICWMDDVVGVGCVQWGLFVL